MTRIAILRPGDEAALERYLATRPSTTMFLRSNLRSAGLVDHGQIFEATYAAAFDGEDVVGAAALCWNGKMILEAGSAEVGPIVQALAAAAPREATGFIGPWPQVLAARDALGFATRAPTMTGKEDLFSLDLADLVVPPGLEGRVRRAVEADLELLVRWRTAYMVEAMNETVPESAVRSDVSSNIARGTMWILDDRPGGTAVAMSAFNATLPEMVQIGGVYTPPEHRARGCARAVVAGSLVDARARGVTRSILFTGETNVPARKAYQALGYRIIGDYGMLFF